MKLTVCEQTQPRPKGAFALDEGTAVCCEERDHSRELWRHPLKQSLEVPYRFAAAIAVMEMGICEYSVIARAVGLTVEEVKRVDEAKDLSVRELAVAGIPVGESFELHSCVRCPNCEAEVNLAPCVACRGLIEETI